MIKIFNYNLPFPCAYIIYYYDCMLYRYTTAQTGSVNMHIIMWLIQGKMFIVREDGQLKVGVEIYKII